MDNEQAQPTNGHSRNPLEENSSQLLDPSPRTTPKFGFLSLPPEIRRRIYKLILTSPIGVLHYARNRWYTDISHTRPYHGSIISTCREIRLETQFLPLELNDCLVCLSLISAARLRARLHHLRLVHQVELPMPIIAAQVSHSQSISIQWETNGTLVFKGTRPGEEHYSNWHQYISAASLQQERTRLARQKVLEWIRQPPPAEEP
ncbi:hypothetical protein EJ04DRAFT_529096 [Polyplosphaeria fusca]|uniref:Uncharacterized protein n=1 Tax=Polyplosphaeria fusca TaxID=682080 RepID=A0A9P4UX46_9PLEO|nr:hypothetical protein EJ04DRAFT_529096 [Polyplosphaeria fusca]